MKIKKFKSKQILKLHLLKSKIYEQTTKKNSFLFDTDLVQIIINFKRALQIIFQYHNAEKKILFIGVPKKLETKINKFTSHAAVPSNLNLQGIFSNYLKNSYTEKSNNKNPGSIAFKRFLPKLSKKPDLIVLFSHDKTQTIISESYFAKIPLLVFDNEIDHNKLNNFYKVETNGNSLANLSNQNLFFLGLNFLFKINHKKKVKTSKSFSSKFSKNNNFRTRKKSKSFN